MPSRPPAIAPRIDAAAECIWRGSEKIGVPPKAFLVLRRLMERPGQLVTKDALFKAVWPDTFLTDQVLNNAIGQLRQALGDDPKQPRFIETVHRRGFRWIAPAALDAAPTPPPISFEDEATTFVGRDDSLAELERCYARAAAGRRQLVLVTGEPGIGKTTLIDQFLRRLAVMGQVSLDRATARLLCRGQCTDSYAAAEPYRPLLEAIEGLLRQGGEETRAAFRKFAPSWLLQMPELLSSEELEELRRNVTASTTARIRRELERVIDAASVDRTVVMILEDLHWSDPATVDLLWGLATRLDPARLLIIGTFRPVDAVVQQNPIVRLKHELVGKRQCLELSLEGLDSTAVAAYLDQRFTGHKLSPTFTKRLVVQTSGNPLFLENALADFEQRGWLREQDGAWQWTVELDTIGTAVPDGTRQLIAFRFDQLAPATKELLEAASVAGMSFTTQAVAAATERDCADVEGECERLTRDHFLQDEGDIEWPDGSCGRQQRFRHALYQQVLSGRVTPTRRQLLHRRIAERLESGYRDRAPEIATQLAFHYERAGDAFRAVDFIDMLVQQAYARRAAYEAEPLLAHAVTLLKRVQESPARQERLLQVTIAHGMALGALHGTGVAVSARAFEEARELGRTIPTSADHIASLGSIVAGKLSMGQLLEARSMGEQILVLAGSDASPATLVTAHLSAGAAQFYLGEIAAALQHLERAFAAIRPGMVDPALAYDPTVPAVGMFGQALVVSGSLERGWSMVLSSLARARTMEMPWYLGWALTMAGAVVAVWRRDIIAARAFATEALAFGENNPMPQFLDANRVVVDWANIMETRDPALVDSVRAGVDAFRVNGDSGYSRVCCNLVDACLVVGRLDEASKVLDDAFDTRGEERFYDAELFRRRASILIARAPGKRSKGARLDEAEQFLERAIEVAAAQGTRLFGLRATVEVCRLWLRTGKRDQARQRLSQALATFDEGFAEVDLIVAKELLVEIDAAKA